MADKSLFHMTIDEIGPDGFRLNNGLELTWEEFAALVSQLTWRTIELGGFREEAAAVAGRAAETLAAHLSKVHRRVPTEPPTERSEGE